MTDTEGDSLLATPPYGTRVPAPPMPVTPGALAEWTSRGVAVRIIDIREPHEFQERHLPGAQNLPMSNPHELVQRVPTDATLLLVCGDGRLSSKAAEVLRKCGLTRACFLEGGMFGLSRASAPPEPPERDRRRYPRAAPRDCTLILKPAAWLPMLQANLALEWIDVSEGGIGVLVSKELRIGEELRARLMEPLYRGAFDALVVVRKVREARSRPGCYVASCEFVDPSPSMRFCIRSVVDTGCLPGRTLMHAIRRME